MIGQGISEIMTFAIGVAISPLPIIALILMLFSERARSNGLAFLLGWIAGLGAVSVITYLATDATDAATHSGASDRASTLKVVLGAVLLGLALRAWRRRDEQRPAPKWMRAVDTIPPIHALALGFLLAAINPKNLILTIGAGTGLGQLGLDTGAVVVSIVFFVALGSVLIAGPVLYDLAGGTRAKEHLGRLKDWFTANHSTVMAVLLLVFGMLLISKGMGLLSA